MPKHPVRSIKILAHRGLVSILAPENTVASFSAAVSAGADIIETDVQVSADGVPIIFHDDDLWRMANSRKRVSDCTFAELQQIDLGHGQRIPSLEQALKVFPTTQFNLDLKSRESVGPTVATIEKLKAHSQVLVSSFSEARRLHALSLFSQPVKTSAGTSKVIKLFVAQKLGLFFIFKRISAGSDALQVPISRGPIRFDSPGFISYSLMAGLEIHFWTINSPSEMVRLADLGASGLVTDHCDLALATLR